MRRLLFAVFLSFLLLSGRSLPASPAARAQVEGVSVSYRAGWNLVSGLGAAAPSIVGPLYTFQAFDTAYEAVPANGPALGGFGYWVYLQNDASFTLRPASNLPFNIRAPAGQYVMIGDPSSSLMATITGADLVYTYDAAGGYHETRQLAPGQGAWALSHAGGTIIMTPGAGIR